MSNMADVAAKLHQETTDGAQLTKLEKFALAALIGVCAAPQEKYDPSNDRMTALKAISIARHAVQELESN